MDGQQNQNHDCVVIKLKSSQTTMKLSDGRIRNVTLYEADDECQHEDDPYWFDGIKCKKCSGWFIR